MENVINMADVMEDIRMYVNIQIYHAHMLNHQVRDLIEKKWFIQDG
jgi:hypothetical protein